MAAFIRERDRKKHFPLRDFASVLRLFRWQLERADGPNLSLLSVVIGFVESSLTNCTLDQRQQLSNKNLITSSTTDDDSKKHVNNDDGFVDDDTKIALPRPLQASTVETLCEKFRAQMKGAVDLSEAKTKTNTTYATRELVKRVSDVIWASLARSKCYKDRAHLQTLYSYLTANKLDCFGVAFAVVAACQVLGFEDVHLTLSEDHAWVVFGKDGEETAEVTWHGKGHEDKRGQPITLGVAEKSWLYLNGRPVKCVTRHMEVAALVSGMNAAMNATTDNVELLNLQRRLLWMLHDMGHLSSYPMALGCLGDLEELNPTSGRPHCTSLFKEAIAATRQHYDNHHVYPYTYLGGYHYRHQKYKEALEAWANAADVIRFYNYSREDEEIYKVFLEIANDLIPQVMKAASGCGRMLQRSLLNDPECFARLLRFYDGICEWEEGSPTPVLHIGWARPLVNTIAKFEAAVRSRIEINVVNNDDNKSETTNGIKITINATSGNPLTNDNESCNIISNSLHITDEPLKTSVECDKVQQIIDDTGVIIKPSNGHENSTLDKGKEDKKKKKKRKKDRQKKIKMKEENGVKHHRHDRRVPDFIRTLEIQINPNEAPHPNIAALAAACADNILNPEYLLGGGDIAFSSSRSSGSAKSSPGADSSTSSSSLPDVRLLDCCDFLISQSNSSTQFPGLTMDAMLEAEAEGEVVNANDDKQNLQQQPQLIQSTDQIFVATESGVHRADDVETVVPISPPVSPKVRLRSEKMKGLKDLLLADKLNVSAIQLQLTAQSQVTRRSSKSSSLSSIMAVGEFEYTMGRSTKRSRRE